MAVQEGQDPEKERGGATKGVRPPLVVPRLGTLLRFTIPTLGVWLAGPIMSLVGESDLKHKAGRLPKTYSVSNVS